MAAAENAEPAATQKGKRRWFRFRFGLRTLLLFMALVAVLLSFEVRRARNQWELAARLDALGGTYDRETREWIPELLRRIMSDDMSGSIVSFSLEVMQVPWGPEVALAEPEEIEELLAMPAMASVRRIDLKGTAVTDDVIDELAALKDLGVVTFQSTAVTENAGAELAELLPTTAVKYHPFLNGPGAVAERHRHVLPYTEDLELFPRAHHGEHEAIAEVLRVVGKVRGQRPAILMNFLARLDRDLALPPITESFRLGDSGTRQAAVELLGGHGEVELLGQALRDTDTDVRLEAVFALAAIEDEPARRLLVAAARNDRPEVRVAALRELPGTPGQEAMTCCLAALEDPDPDVRWQAIYAIGGNPDERAVGALVKSLSDENSVNRCAAAKALGKIADPRALGPLEAAVKDKDEYVREAAEDALAKIGAQAEG